MFETIIFVTLVLASGFAIIPFMNSLSKVAKQTRAAQDYFIENAEKNRATKA